MSTDRTADRQSYLCAAYGCPMLGTRSASTAGGDFMCHVHFGLEGAQLQAATFEVNRLAWLANAIRDIRARSRNPNWRETYARIDHDIALAQREDLRFKVGEDALGWMLRLEAELAAMVKVAIAPHEQEQFEGAPA